MTEQDTKELLAVVAAAYPDHFKGISRKRAQAIVALWSGQLASADAEIISVALQRHIRESSWAPKIADLFRIIKTMYFETKERYMMLQMVDCDRQVMEEVRLLLRKIENMGVDSYGNANYIGASGHFASLGASTETGI